MTIKTLLFLIVKDYINRIIKKNYFMTMIMIDDYGLILYVFLHKLISCITYLNHFTYKYLYLRSYQEQMIEEEQILQLSNDGSTFQN